MTTPCGGAAKQLFKRQPPRPPRRQLHKRRLGERQIGLHGRTRLAGEGDRHALGEIDGLDSRLRLAADGEPCNGIAVRYLERRAAIGREQGLSESAEFKKV